MLPHELAKWKIELSKEEVKEIYKQGVIPIAATQGNVALMDSVLRSYDIDLPLHARTKKLFMLAMKGYHLDMVKYLLVRGFETNNPGKESIFFTALIVVLSKRDPFFRKKSQFEDDC